MSDEFADYPTIAPDFGQFLNRKMGQTPTNGFDPHALMLKKKSIENGEVEIPKQTWPQEHVDQLEQFCREHGIFGFNSGKMSPLAALAMLKRKMGVPDSNGIPFGYQPIGTKEVLSNNLTKKSVIYG